MIRLHVAPLAGEAFDYQLAGDSVVIGRATTSDLVLEDRFLSRHHSRIFRQGDGWMIEDLGSRNGTHLNGFPVHGPVALTAGDVVKLSGSSIRITAGEPGENGERLDVLAPPSQPRPASPYPTPPTLGEQTILRSVSGLLSDVVRDSEAIEGEEALRRYADRLRLLNDVHRALGQSMELDELLELILERIFAHLRPEHAAIFLRRGGELELAASRKLPEIEERDLHSRSLVREVTEKGMAALVMDVTRDERFSASQSMLGTGIRSLVAAPLLDPQGNLGMIVLASRAAVRQFSEEDMELLVSLASVASLCLRNVALAEEAAERRRLEQELALGRRIQVALLPDRLPDVAGWELFARNRPSRGLSGDYYHLLERGDGKECVVMVADVAGKGIGASLLTASLEALSAGPIEDGLPPDEICLRLSRLLYRRTPPERYATAFLAVLEPGSGRLVYANAGHCPPFILRASGELAELEGTGPPLGLVPAAAYRPAEAELAPGELLVVYTDGIIEAATTELDEYGLDRFVDLCRTGQSLPLDELFQHLSDDLDRFVAGEPYADDRTLVLARRAG